ncbi:hypothetical protein C0992_007131 [Termitomyces sp. T32_za158]|nr:hypothetical protein C0992_007131 [Termitomyces sp. T32_za158]
MSNEAWWYLMEFNKFPADVENRLVRLIIGFLSFAAFDMIPTPLFCRFEDPAEDDICRAARKNLSLSGIIITHMTNSNLIMPFPSRSKARNSGCIVWNDIEVRSHVFGALKNESDAFTEAFLRELRGRPDLFQVITHSETDPPLKVDPFGDGPNAALSYVRMRTFEAPITGSPIAEQGPWEVKGSAMDRLYGTGKLPEYLTEINRRTWKKNGTSFFRFLSFPVKYFVILDTVPR